MEGRVLGNRYELIEKIGGGGMAFVYKAKCKLLNRFVAVKILRPEFTNDEEFVKRFRIEAQSAASLSHPNIVSIYDVGHEESIYYIVMELVDGVTLKEFISQKGALKWREAVNIAIQICSAIEHAHRNHIVHRDIKPHNIILTRDGIAKVADFGIARAVSSSTITMVGSTIGSVHYFSPEQARGGYTDEKSDLYSLGITLYEMVTGKVPFDGETPVAVALKHIQEHAVQPIEYNVEIPKGVNQIILKAIKKEQNQRYQTASEMLEDLYRVLKEPNGEFAAAVGENDFPTKRIPVIDQEKIMPKGDETVKSRTSAKVKKRNDYLTYWLAGITATVIMVVFGWAAYAILNGTNVNESTDGFKVGEYVGRNFEQVKAELADEKINVEDTQIYDNVEAGLIVSQDMEAGKPLKPGATIKFEVSKGPELVKVPDVRKYEYRSAESKLLELNLQVDIRPEHHENIANGLVIKTEPDYDEEVKPGTTVIIYRSIGPELRPVKVPDLIGKTIDEAKQALSGANLKLGKIVPEGEIDYVKKIIRQEPSPNTEVKEDDAVDLYFETENSTELYQKLPVELMNPEEYEDSIKVRVEIIRSDTNLSEKLLEEEKIKSDFPLQLQIPVPRNGNTRVSVFLNDVLYKEETLQDISEVQ